MVHAFVVCNDYYTVYVCDVFEIYDNNIYIYVIYIKLYFRLAMYITYAQGYIDIVKRQLQ